jgi:hypothetical protein
MLIEDDMNYPLTFLIIFFINFLRYLFSVGAHDMLPSMWRSLIESYYYMLLRYDKKAVVVATKSDKHTVTARQHS